jgi:hypothetical protein
MGLNGYETGELTAFFVPMVRSSVLLDMCIDS